MIDAIMLIRGIYVVAEQIYDQVKLVKANQSQFGRLATRIKIITEAIKRLELIKNKEQYQAGLERLHNLLQECLTFTKEFTDAKKWHKYVWKTYNFDERFRGLNDELQRALTELNLGLAAQQIINHEEDKIDQLNDLKFLLRELDKIFDMGHAAYEAINQLGLKQKERDEILKQQVSSIRLHLKDLITSKTTNALSSNQLAQEQNPVIAYFEIFFEKQLPTVNPLITLYHGKWQDKPVLIQKLNEELSQPEIELLVKQFNNLTSLKHPNLIQYYGICIEPQPISIVMELTSETLKETLLKRKLSPSEQKQSALALAKGLAYLHDQNILQRNLTLDQIFLLNGEVKLANFSLETVASLPRLASITKLDSNNSRNITEAPEIQVKNSIYTAASDIYSYGIILLAIFTGRIDEIILQAIIEDKKEVIPTNIPLVYIDLIKSCCSKVPSQRPSLASIIKQIEKTELDVTFSDGEQWYLKGIEAERNGKFLEAYQSYLRSADAGFGKANTNLASFFKDGKSDIVRQDKKEAYSLFLKGANSGHPRAMFDVAVMLERGDGIPRDKETAINWYKKAADAGDKDAEVRLAKLLNRKSNTNNFVDYKPFDFSQQLKK